MMKLSRKTPKKVGKDRNGTSVSMQEEQLLPIWQVKIIIVRCLSSIEKSVSISIDDGSSQQRKSDDSEGQNRTSSDEQRQLDENEDQLDRESVGSTSEDAKNEKMFVRVVRSIRTKFMSRRLIGNIYVYRAAGFVSTAMQCQIGETDYFSTPAGSLHSVDALDGAGLGYKRAVTMTDTILDSLERRAMSWDGVDFNGEVTLSRGAKFSLAGPFIGIVGYTLSLEISATVQSLIDSRKKFLTHRTPSMSFSNLARSLSFSFSGGRANSVADTSTKPSTVDSSNQATNTANTANTQTTTSSTADDASNIDNKDTTASNDALTDIKIDNNNAEKSSPRTTPKKAPNQHIMV